MGGIAAVMPTRGAAISLTVILTVSALQWSPEVRAAGVIIPVTVKPYPSLPGGPWIFTWYYGCYSIHDGRPINCSFTHKVIGLKTPHSDPNNNGGHFHFANRPLSLQNKPLQHDGDLDPDPWRCRLHVAEPTAALRQGRPRNA